MKFQWNSKRKKKNTKEKQEMQMRKNLSQKSVIRSMGGGAELN